MNKNIKNNKSEDIRKAFIKFLLEGDAAVQEYRREIDNKRRELLHKGKCCLPFDMRFLCIGDCEFCDFCSSSQTKCDEFYCEKCDIAKDMWGKAQECTCCMHCYSDSTLSLDAECGGEDGGTLMDTLEDKNPTPEEAYLKKEFHEECKKAIKSVFKEGKDTMVYDQIIDGNTTKGIAKELGLPRKTYEYQQGKIKKFM